MPTVDAHSDLLLELVQAEQGDGEPNPFRTRWLPSLASGGVGLQVCAAFVDPHLPAAEGLPQLLRQVHSFHAAVAANADAAFAVQTASDLERVGGGDVGLLLSVEGAAAVGDAVWLVDVLAQLGVRMLSPTWNERNAFAAGCDHPEDGLTPLGEQLIERLLARGVAIDLAHASPRTIDEVLACVGEHPVLVSHAGCRAQHDHPRNLDDRRLAAIAAQGGVLGLMPHPLTVGLAEPTLERFLDQVDHAVGVMGVEHVGLGGDFLRQIAAALGEADVIVDGMRMDAAIEGLAGPADWPALDGALAERGYDGAARAAILGGNLLRLLRRTLPPG